MKKLILLFLAMALLLSACGSYSVGSNLYDSNKSENFFAAGFSSDLRSAADYEAITALYESDDYSIAPSNAPTAESAMGAETMSDEATVPSAGKLIRTANVTMESMEFESAVAAVEAMVTKYGGYIQASSTTGTGAVARSTQVSRNAYYTLRIPVENFFAFYDGLDECGSVTHRNHSAQDVSDYYYDTEARLKTLRLQEERLLVLMSQATDLEAVITLEKTLADTRYQIESHEGTLRQLDSKISYSTFDVTIYEVFEPTQYVTVPKTLGERISQRFQSTWEDLTEQGEFFIVWLLGDSISILLTLASLVAVFFLLRTLYRRWNARIKHNATPPTPPPPVEEEDSEK